MADRARTIVGPRLLEPEAAAQEPRVRGILPQQVTNRAQAEPTLLQLADEAESLDVAMYGSEDGQNWQPKPILKLPQRFYRSETRMVLDLTARPEVNAIRAGWELNRWGRVSPLPVFVFGLHATEVPAMPAKAPRPHETLKA